MISTTKYNGGKMVRCIFSLILFLSLVSCGGDDQWHVTGNSDGVSEVKKVNEEDLAMNSGIKTGYVSGEIIVKFRELTDTVKISALHKASGAIRLREIRNIGVHQLKVPAHMSVEQLISQYRADPDVEYAEPNYIIKKAALPDDPNFSFIWGLNNTGQTGGIIDADIDAVEAWDVTKGSRNIIIAVIDSGIAYNHPDLSGNIWINTAEQSGKSGIDDDGNGYADDIYGWDFIDNDGYPLDLNSHGTHVAGIIGACGNNGIGITGIMWAVKIMPLRFLGVSGTGDTLNAADAIVYAADHGARIINASWAGYKYSNALYDAIDYVRKKGVLFVAAAGNEENNNDIEPAYPGSYNLPNIISVAATDDSDNLASFSNYGAKSVDLGAPGVSIYSTIPQFIYGTPVTIYSENFDSDSGALPILGWSLGGINSTWAVTEGTGVNGTNSLEDSPEGAYLPNTNSWAGYMTAIPSVKNNLYTLSFKWKGFVNPLTFDYLNINYSLDGIDWDWFESTYGYTFGKFISYSTDAITAAADILDTFYFGFGLESGPLGGANGVFIDEVLLEREAISISNYTYESQGWDGTSMAAPYVTGVAGLILSVNPSLSFEQVKDIILKSVDPLSTLAGVTVSGGRLNASTAMSYIMPSAPAGLTATALSSSQIDLAWTDNSPNESGFKIERKKGAGGTYNIIVTVGANSIAYSDTGLSAGATYFYRIKAYNLGGDSLPSEESSATTFQSPSDGDNGGGGGCSVGMVHNYQTAIADTVVLMIPFAVIWILRKFRKY